MSDIEVLRVLAELDEREKELRSRAEYIPKSIEETRELLSKAEAEASDARGRAEAQRRTLRSLELGIEEMNEKLSKYSRQLLDVKTNKEYQSLKKEIADLEKAVSEREEQMLETMVLLDEYDRLACDVEEKVKSTKGAQETTITKLERELKDTEVQLLEVREKRKKAVEKLSVQIRKEYTKVMSRYTGEAIVPVINGVCNGCFVNIPPNVVSELRAGNNIIRCDQCGRFLYYGDERE